jgi:hypothetical protein
MLVGAWRQRLCQRKQEYRLIITQSITGKKPPTSHNFFTKIRGKNPHSIQLGNLISRRPHRRRGRSGMAAASSAAASVSTSTPPPIRFDFSPDSPPRLALTPDQFARCSEALGFFRQKLSAPQTIAQEFARLQVGCFGCSSCAPGNV